MNPLGILEAEVRLGVGGREEGSGEGEDMAEKGHIRRNSEEVIIHLKRK